MTSSRRRVACLALRTEPHTTRRAWRKPLPELPPRLRGDQRLSVVPPSTLRIVPDM